MKYLTIILVAIICAAIIIFTIYTSSERIYYPDGTEFIIK